MRRLVDAETTRPDAVPSGEEVETIGPDTAPLTYAGLSVLELADGEERQLHLAADEAALVPLAGSADLELATATEHISAHLTGRPSPFAGATDYAYVPPGSRVVVRAVAGSLRLAVATARPDPMTTTTPPTPHPIRIVAASEVAVAVRGGGVCTRLVRNYTLGSDVARERLLVCEVITPGGNWSSYPPHKHDEHSDVERALEEIYYYEIAPGPTGGAGVGYHRTYGTPERPIDVLTPVASGDVVLVPHGFHGPCIASPGHDMYYLNVMAGPETDGRWLATDDPALAWVRESWSGEEVDPRLADYGREQ